MSKQIQSLAILSVLFGVTQPAFAADPQMRFMSIPKSINTGSTNIFGINFLNCSSCHPGSEAKVRFATKSDSETCTYRHEGSGFNFVGCEATHLVPGDLLVGQSVTFEAPTLTYKVPYPVILYAPYYYLTYVYTNLFGRPYPMAIWVLGLYPYLGFEWRTVTVAGCPGDNGAAFGKEVAKIYDGAKPACGGVADKNTTLLGDLNCADATWAGLQFAASGSKYLDGRRHSIVASNAKLGLFLTGEGITVQRLAVVGRRGNTAVQAYNSDKLLFRNNKFTGNGIGLNVYTDSVAPSQITIKDNDFSGNVVGVKFNGDGAKRAVNPLIVNNDVSNSGSYGLWLDVRSVTLNHSNNNKFDNSANGIMFMGADVTAKGLDFSRAGVRGRQLSFVATPNVYVSNSDFSYTAPATDAGDRIALDFYRAGEVHVQSVYTANADVGVKIATDYGVSTSAFVSQSFLTDATLAGVMVQSFDGTPMGTISVTDNDFRGNQGQRGLWVVPGTVIKKLIQNGNQY